MDILIKIGLVLLLVFLNAFFVASEFSLVAIRRTRVEELTKRGNLSAKLLHRALKELDKYISATQLGITIASLALGWVGEPALEYFLLPYLDSLENSFLSLHAISALLAFSLITFLHIVLGELTPKSLAIRRAEKIALFIISPLVVFTNLFYPVIWILSKSGRLVLRILRVPAATGQQMTHSEEEIKMLLQQSSKSGAIPSKEVEMVYNIFQLGDIPVRFIMIPRTDVVAFNVAMTVGDVVKRVEKNSYSRFPVFEGTIDNIVGFIHVKDIYRELIKQGEKTKLSGLKIVRNIINVPEVKKIDAVLQEMRRKRIHLAIVNDEFGGTAGIVTLEDIIESVVGEIEDEFDKPLKNIVRQKDGSYLIEGHTLIDDMREKFSLPFKGQGYTTIGGLVFGLLGHEPRVGDRVQMSTLTFEVKQILGKRIKLLRMKRETKRKKKA